MNKKGLLMAVLLSCSILTAGCSAGNVKVKTAASTTRTKETKAEKKQGAITEKKEKAKQAKIRQKALGKVSIYGLPLGPSWLYVYENGKNTKATFDPNNNATVKLHEQSDFQVGGKLPLVGQVMTNELNVNQSSGEATMDEADSSHFTKKITTMSLVGSNDNLEFNFLKLNNIDSKAVSKMAFTDLPKYLEAASTNDASKLPNQSQQLANSLDSSNIRGDAEASYKVIEQYYDKSTAHTDGSDLENSTFIRVNDDDNFTPKSSTRLSVATYAKVKKSYIDQHAIRIDGLTPEYGKTTTEIDQFQLIYHLTADNKWELMTVNSFGGSEYAMDTSESKWIVQKQ